MGAGDVLHESLLADVLPRGVLGVDSGLTLTKTARQSGEQLDLRGWETVRDGAHRVASEGDRVGATGARAASLDLASALIVQEIDAGARGACALLAATGGDTKTPFVLAMLGTGTAFAVVREARATHLGGTALGGGSFAGIARRLAPGLTYDQMIARAARGDRRKADLMVSDAYPNGIGRIGSDMTAAHLARPGDGASVNDVLAALLNLHGENIAQIAGSRAVVAQVRRIVLAGGFVHGSTPLIESISHMAAMFGVQVEVVVAPGFAGAIGAALVAADGP